MKRKPCPENVGNRQCGKEAKQVNQAGPIPGTVLFICTAGHQTYGKPLDGD